MDNMKKYFFVFLSLLLSTTSVFAEDYSIQDNIIPDTTSNVVATVDGSGSQGFDLLDSILLYIKDSIFNLLALFAIGVFLYIGFLLVTARWNPEQFKKAMKAFVYAVVGLVVVALAWAAVRMVAWLTL